MLLPCSNVFCNLLYIQNFMVHLPCMYLGQAIKMHQRKMKVIKNNQGSFLFERKSRKTILDKVSAKLLGLVSCFTLTHLRFFCSFRLLSSASHICHFLDQKNTFLVEELSQSWLKMPTFQAIHSPFQRYLLFKNQSSFLLKIHQGNSARQ